jgi:hypothetical protein
VPASPGWSETAIRGLADRLGLNGDWGWQLFQAVVRTVLHVAALLGLGGVWMWAFLGYLQHRPPPAYETSVAAAETTR